MQMQKKNGLVIIFICLGMVFSIFSPALSQERQNVSTPPSDKLTLGHAVMCEGIRDYKPENVAVVFSISIGRVSCYTAFDVVPARLITAIITEQGLIKKPNRRKVKSFLNNYFK